MRSVRTPAYDLSGAGDFEEAEKQMNAEEAYRKVQSLIGDLSTQLTRGEYEDFVTELHGHIQSLQDCIDEENEAEQDK